ncbi:hypothetical protein [Anaerocolumna aminovalerica]|nr:hypothetical protein [Anaerocolumna aminovalerica]
MAVNKDRYGLIQHLTVMMYYKKGPTIRLSRNKLFTKITIF